MRVLLALLAGVICAGTSHGDARPIDFEGRAIPAYVSSDNVLTGSLTGRFVPAGRSLLIKPTLTQDQLDQSFALLVPGVTETAEATITVNGQELWLMPILRADGALYLLDAPMLQEGENRIMVERDEPAGWSGLAMFSLRGASEEAHLHQYFSDEPAPSISEMIREFPVSALQTNFDALWYDCTWVPDIPLYGESTANGRLLAGTQVTMGARTTVANVQTIELDFDMYPTSGGTPRMQVTSIDSGPGTPALAWTYVHHPNTPRLRITLPAPLPINTEFQVRVAYHGTANHSFDKVIFGQPPLQSRRHRVNSSSPYRPVYYTVSQAYGGRRWWPSKDHPSDKATTTVQRIVVPKRAEYTLTPVSNGTLTGTTDNGATITWEWTNHYPIATYLVSMAISNYTYHGTIYTSQDGTKSMPLGHYIYPYHVNEDGLGYVGTLQVMNFFADKFGEYPFIDEKYQTAAWNVSWAIEHQTATSMPAGVSTGVWDGLTRRNVHELAHHWFGNKVTGMDWDQLWLNEGFATHCEALFFEHLYGRQRYHDIMNAFSLSRTDPIIGPNTDNFGGSIAYNKGAWVLHMLRNLLGDDAFFQALKDYAATGYISTASQPGQGMDVDFQTVVEQSAGLAPASMQTFFTQWLYSPNAQYEARPAYSFSSAYDIETSSVLVKMGQHQGKTNFLMPVDIQLTSADSATTTIRLPMGTSEMSFPLGGFVPATANFDVDDWIMKDRRATIRTANLPNAVEGLPYSAALQGSSGESGLSWQKQSGTPAWVSVSSSGIVSGTPPAPGIYPVNVRLQDGSAAAVTANFKLVVRALVPPPPGVINELNYEDYFNPDNTEYVELRNNSAEPADISGWQIVPVSGSTGNAIASAVVTIPTSTVLAPGAYYVVGNAANVNAAFGNVVNLDSGWNESLYNLAPGAIVLKDDLGQRVDSVAYRADVPMASGAETARAIAEGGTGRQVSRALTAPGNAVLGRLPDGADSQVNLQDFAMIPPSPGVANSAGVSLPFFDNFNSGIHSSWRTAFASLRTATAGATGKPAIAPPAPAGGPFLEVVDTSGGGDVAYLPGAFNKLNAEGYLWIPQTVTGAPWSTGVGVGTRVESAWFSSTTGYEMPHGFYLEYQNGPGVNLRGGVVPNGAGQARLLAINSLAAPNVGTAGTTVQVLGTAVSPTPASWQPFRIFMDQPANRLYAEMSGTAIYDGPIPASLRDVTGGFVVGFRENHTGAPAPANREATWLDNLTLNADTTGASEVTDYQLY